jgi:hypothetical protein
MVHYVSFCAYRTFPALLCDAFLAVHLSRATVTVSQLGGLSWRSATESLRRALAREAEEDAGEDAEEEEDAEEKAGEESDAKAEAAHVRIQDAVRKVRKALEEQAGAGAGAGLPAGILAIVAVRGFREHCAQLAKPIALPPVPLPMD